MRAGGGTILVVDDNSNVLEFVRTVLEDEGYLVKATQKARRVLDEFDGVPDLVITDIFMPGMDGYEFIQAVRNRWPRAKVPAISAGGDVGPGPGHCLQVAKSLGAQEMLCKPFSPTEMVEAVSCILRPEESS